VLIVIGSGMKWFNSKSPLRPRGATS
jgi:hypothetical protein